MYILYGYVTIYILTWRRTVYKWANAAHHDQYGLCSEADHPWAERLKEPPCGFCLFFAGFFWGSLMNVVWPWWGILAVAKWLHANKRHGIHAAALRLTTPRPVRKDHERKQLEARITELEKELLP